MKEEIYQWVKNLAVFYIVFTAILHLIPDRKYERFVRAFMGLLLIFMLCSPVFSLLGKSRELSDTFSSYYQQEIEGLETKEAENLQKFYLQEGYELELNSKIQSICEKKGIKTSDTTVHIEGERAQVILYVQEELSQTQERGIRDAFWTDCGIRQEDIQIVVDEDKWKTMDSSAAFGSAFGSSSMANAR